MVLLHFKGIAPILTKVSTYVYLMIQSLNMNFFLSKTRRFSDILDLHSQYFFLIFKKIQHFKRLIETISKIDEL
jgi:hypothetical protein